jgi:hypothetical protein
VGGPRRQKRYSVISTLCKIPRNATGGDDDAYRVLQSYCEVRSASISYDPRRYEYEYSTRIRSWISESRISDTITNIGGVRGGEAPPRTGMGGPNSVEAHHPLFFYRDRLEALSGLLRPSRRKPKCDRTATRRHLLPLLGATSMPLVAIGRHKHATCCHMNATCCHWASVCHVYNDKS